MRRAGSGCYGLDEILEQYMRAKNSLTSNIMKSVKGVWYLYRKVEHLSISFNCYCFVSLEESIKIKKKHDKQQELKPLWSAFQ